ncbi:hypothetical protein OSB04_un001754 [Centaurea solstitialis]|uniref:Uncharacterized protein n=1 Tax=Centaurea solstitialis TaxID=347529 RepID=A0AA38SF41_9ASTR|nr:hypothetical protein OSB04_un001754 [Centaurea solstitialis]
MIRRFNMDKAYMASTPMIGQSDDDEEVFGAGILYLSTIGALLYLSDHIKVIPKLDKELPSGTYQLLESKLSESYVTTHSNYSDRCTWLRTIITHIRGVSILDSTNTLPAYMELMHHVSLNEIKIHQRQQSCTTIPLTRHKGECCRINVPSSKGSDDIEIDIRAIRRPQPTVWETGTAILQTVTPSRWTCKGAINYLSPTIPIILETSIREGDRVIVRAREKESSGVRFRLPETERCSQGKSMNLRSFVFPFGVGGCLRWRAAVAGCGRRWQPASLYFQADGGGCYRWSVTCPAPVRYQPAMVDGVEVAIGEYRRRSQTAVRRDLMSTSSRGCCAAAI